MIENYLVIDTFIVRGIQSTNLQNQVNPIYLDIGKNSNFNDFFVKHPNTRFIIQVSVNKYHAIYKHYKYGWRGFNNLYRSEGR